MCCVLGYWIQRDSAVMAVCALTGTLAYLGYKHKAGGSGHILVADWKSSCGLAASNADVLAYLNRVLLHKRREQSSTGTEVGTETP